MAILTMTMWLSRAGRNILLIGRRQRHPREVVCLKLHGITAGYPGEDSAWWGPESPRTWSQAWLWLSFILDSLILSSEWMDLIVSVRTLSVPRNRNQNWPRKRNLAILGLGLALNLEERNQMTSPGPSFYFIFWFYNLWFTLFSDKPSLLLCGSNPGCCSSKPKFLSLQIQWKRTTTTKIFLRSHSPGFIVSHWLWLRGPVSHWGHILDQAKVTCSTTWARLGQWETGSCRGTFRDPSAYLGRQALTLLSLLEFTSWGGHTSLCRKEG